MDVSRGDLLYDGKSKAVYGTSDPGLVILEFKDDATAFNGKKHALIADKGRVNCAVSSHLFDEVDKAGLRTHKVETISETEMICRRVEIIPVEVVVRNVAAGSFASRYGLDEGAELPRPIVEYFYKSDELGDPVMGRDVPLLMGWAEEWEMVFMSAKALLVNEVMGALWADIDIDLVDFKLEFGRTPGGALVLADELTPDGSRLWEQGTGRRLDKDVFRRDLGDLSDTYHEVYRRVFGEGLSK